MADELEWKTRRDRINKRLQGLSPAWKSIKYSENLNLQSLKRHAVEEYPNAKGPAGGIQDVIPDRCAPLDPSHGRP